MNAASLPLVVIDPGHGGRDSGAIGVHGTPEKQVALAAALELRHLLLATGKFRVAMTRSADISVSLAQRVAFARQHHASVVIAIHANASPNPLAHGASVWIRSGRDDPDLTHLPARKTETRQIANALTTPDQSRPGSAWLQSTLIDNLSDDIRMENIPARQAHFYVLGLRHIPSVLLEMGFLSNTRDEALLRQPAYRRKITESIRDALEEYVIKLSHPHAKHT